MLTVTAIALATFKLFVDTDIKRVVSIEDILDGAMHTLIPPELTDEII